MWDHLSPEGCMVHSHWPLHVPRLIKLTQLGIRRRNTHMCCEHLKQFGMLQVQTAKKRIIDSNRWNVFKYWTSTSIQCAILPNILPSLMNQTPIAISWPFYNDVIITWLTAGGLQFTRLPCLVQSHTLSISMSPW